MTALTQEALCKNYGIAITGGVASGKSSVTKLLSSWGYLCIDADQLSRKAVVPGSPALKKLAENFGKEILASDGSLERQKLRNLIFQDPAKRKVLEGILHPEIRRLMNLQLVEEGLLEAPRLWFYEAALIFEAGLASDFKETWLVYVDVSEQERRLVQRDSMSAEQARAIIGSQMSNEDKIKRADVLIHNNGDLNDLSQRLQQLLAERAS